MWNMLLDSIFIYFLTVLNHILYYRYVCCNDFVIFCITDKVIIGINGRIKSNENENRKECVI